MKQFLLFFMIIFCANVIGMEPQGTSEEVPLLRAIQTVLTVQLKTNEAIQELKKHMIELGKACEGIQRLEKLLNEYSPESDDDENDEPVQENQPPQQRTDELQSCHGLIRNPRVMGLCSFFGYYVIIAPTIKRWADKRKNRLLKTVGNLCALDGKSWRAVPGAVAWALRKPFYAKRRR